MRMWIKASAVSTTIALALAQSPVVSRTVSPNKGAAAGEPAPKDTGAIALPFGASSETCGGEQWFPFFEEVSVRNVSSPTLLPILPQTKASDRPAVIVAPGGGFLASAMKVKELRWHANLPAKVWRRSY